MASTFKSIPLPQYEHMTSEVIVDTVVAIYRSRGMVTEEEMNDLDIIKEGDTGRKKPKDARAPHQQRALVLNAEYTIQHFKVYW